MHWKQTFVGWTMNILWLDLETFSTVPIEYGVHAYKEGSEILLFAYALDNLEPCVVDVANGEPYPRELTEAIKDDGVIVCAHNSSFDRTILNHHGIVIPIHRWRDTMVQALSCGLPASLAELGAALGLPQDKAKDAEGKKHIRLFSVPQPVNRKVRRCTCQTHPAEWQAFKDYAGRDITAMRECAKRMPMMPKAEWNIWHIDQTINDRGICIDTDLVEGALEAIAGAKVDLDRRVAEITDGALSTANQRDAMLRYLRALGCDLPDLTKATVESALAKAEGKAKALLGIRQRAGRTSTAKYEMLRNAVNADSRLRGTLQFAGASRTARWSGRLFQPQNLPRPDMDNEVIETGIEALKAGTADLFFDDVMGLTANTLRGCIVAPHGSKLVVADLSNIEGRVLAWIAGEDWKIKAFNDFDRGVGHDLYKVSYAKSFGVDPEEVTKAERQIGKVQELALGYGGGASAFSTFATAFRIDLDELADRASNAIEPRLMMASADALEFARSRGMQVDMSDKAFIACDSFKRAWREAHPAISSFWTDIEDGFKRAAVERAKLYVRGLAVDGSHQGFVSIELPSYRKLYYWKPEIRAGRITFMGTGLGRTWQRLETFGGRLTENIVQATARDVLAYNLGVIEKQGYQVVLTVHDEIIAETPDSDKYNADSLAHLMTLKMAWMDGLPLAAAGFEAGRYRKD